LADFFPNWNFPGVFSVRISEAALGGAGDIIFIILTPNEQKRHGPLEKPLRMTDMRITLICMSVIQQTVKTKKNII
jgi:hypothetical protein